MLANIYVILGPLPFSSLDRLCQNKMLQFYPFQSMLCISQTAMWGNKAANSLVFCHVHISMGRLHFPKHFCPNMKPSAVHLGEMAQLAGYGSSMCIPSLAINLTFSHLARGLQRKLVLREAQGLQVLILLFENVNCLAVMLSSGFNRFLVPGQPCRSGILTSLVAFSSIINSENIEGSD